MLSYVFRFNVCRIRDKAFLILFISFCYRHPKVRSTAQRCRRWVWSITRVQLRGERQSETRGDVAEKRSRRVTATGYLAEQQPHFEECPTGRHRFLCLYCRERPGQDHERVHCYGNRYVTFHVTYINHISFDIRLNSTFYICFNPLLSS